jgi:Mrp family chromosome partitioning ATPase
MARIREALRGSEVIREHLAPAVPSSAAREAAPTIPDSPEEIPFIEVGGRQTPMEASPSVLASAPPRVAKRPVADASPAPSPAPHVMADVAHAPAIPAPKTLLFRPFPDAPAVLPPADARFAKRLVAFHEPDHPTSEQYRQLSAALEAQLGRGKARILMFAPGTAAVDSTTVLLNLAIARVRLNATPVAIVDANLRRPALARSLGLPGAPGLRELLGGQISLRRSLQETGQSNLIALVAGVGVETDLTMLARPAMRSVLNHLRSRFDWILIDAPCWSGRPELAALAAACDAVYLVLPAGDADDRDREDLMRVMVEQGAPVRGCIFASPAGTE